MKRTIALLILLLGMTLLAVGQDTLALIKAVETGNLKALRALVNRGVSPDVYRPADQRSMFTIALENGDRDIAQYLVQLGAPIDGMIDGKYPIEFCKDDSTKAWLRRLNQAGEDLQRALMYKDYFTISTRVEQGYPVDLCCRGFRLLYGASVNGMTDMVAYLLKLGAKPDLPYDWNHGQVCLLNAAGKGHLEVVRLLVDHGADVNYNHKGHTTALLSALTFKKVEVARLLIMHGADVNFVGFKGSFPLAAAAAIGDTALIGLLVARGAKLPATPTAQSIMLHAAAVPGDLALFKQLSRQFHLDTLGPYRGGIDSDYNPLTAAAAHDSLDLVQYLVEVLHCPAYSAPNKLSPLEVATAAGHLQIVTYLISRGANMNFASRPGMPPIMIAIQNCKPHLLQYFLKQGADTQVVRAHSFAPTEFDFGPCDPVMEILGLAPSKIWQEK